MAPAARSAAAAADTLQRRFCARLVREPHADPETLVPDLLRALQDRTPKLYARMQRDLLDDHDDNKYNRRRHGDPFDVRNRKQLADLWLVVHAALRVDELDVFRAWMKQLEAYMAASPTPVRKPASYMHDLIKWATISSAMALLIDYQWLVDERVNVWAVMEWLVCGKDDAMARLQAAAAAAAAVAAPRPLAAAYAVPVVATAAPDPIPAAAAEVAAEVAVEEMEVVASATAADPAPEAAPEVAAEEAVEEVVVASSATAAPDPVPEAPQVAAKMAVEEVVVVASTAADPIPEAPVVAAASTTAAMTPVPLLAGPYVQYTPEGHLLVQSIDFYLDHAVAGRMPAAVLRAMAPHLHKLESVWTAPKVQAVLQRVRNMCAACACESADATADPEHAALARLRAAGDAAGVKRFTEAAPVLLAPLAELAAAVGPL